MTQSLVTARADQLERRAGSAQAVAFVTGAAAVVLLLVGLTRLWRSSDSVVDYAVHDLGAAVAVAILGVALAVVAAASWVVAAQREAAAETIRLLAER